MEQSSGKPENGSFKIDMHGDWGVVHRYFSWGRNEISFSGVVTDPLRKSAIEMHIESTKAVIAYLQALVDRAESDLRTGR